MPTSSLEQLLTSIRTQIAQGQLLIALDRLQNYLAASAPDLRNEVILHIARYNRLQREDRKGIIPRDVARSEENRLVNDVLELLEEIPGHISHELTPVLTPEASFGEYIIPEEVGLERIWGSNNLKQIAWIERGLMVSKCVCRILTPDGLGTGFLIAPDRLITNNHVLPDSTVTAHSVAEFNYQQDLGGSPLPTCRYALDPNRFHTDPTLDYTVAGVVPDPAKPDLESWGHALLNPYADPVAGEHVVIIQHPNGGLKQIVLTANQVVSSWEHRIHYTTDTMPGSSGSPVFNDVWQVIAIHHAGGNLQVNSKGDKRFVNEAILFSAIGTDIVGSWLENQT